MSKSKSTNHTHPKSLSEDEKQFITDLTLKSNTNEAVNPNSKESPAPSWFRKNWLLVASIVILTLFAMSFFSNIVSFNLDSKLKKHELNDSTSTQTISLKKPDGLAGLQLTLYEVDELLANRKFATAESKLTAALKTYKAKTDQAQIQLKLGAVYMNAVSYKSALQACQKAEQLGIADNRTYLCIALAAESTGEKKLAAKYYQKAYEISKTDQNIEGEGESYRLKAEELGR